MNSLTWQAAFNICKALPQYASKYGLWHVPSGAWQFTDHWQMAYLGSAISLAASVTENTRALFVLNALVRWFDHVVAEFGDGTPAAI